MSMSLGSAGVGKGTVRRAYGVLKDSRNWAFIFEGRSAAGGEGVMVVNVCLVIPYATFALLCLFSMRLKLMSMYLI